MNTACIEERWLYLKSDNYEDRVFKTQMLYLSLQSFNELDHIPEIIKSNMIGYLKSFLNDNNYFNVDNIELKRNLFDFEIVILQSLILLDKHTNENLLELVKTKEAWLIQNVDALNKELESTDGTKDMIFLNDCILNLNHVLVSAELYNLFNKSYTDNNDFNFIGKIYLMDTQMTYKILKVCQILDKTIDTKTSNFINENINYWIFDEPPVTNLKELYYSLNLAQIYDINFNTNKIINYINKFKNSTSLQDIYYNYLLNNELSTPFIANETTLRTIEENIQDFDSKSLEQKFYLIHLYKFFNLNSVHFNDITKNLTQENIEYKILETNIESDFFYLSKIADELNIDLDSHFINNQIEKYRIKGGGYCIEKTGDSPNTISTYRMIELKAEYGIQIDNEELHGISVFTNKIKGTKGGYYYIQPSNPPDINNYDKNFSFMSFYCGEILNKFIERRSLE